MTDWIDLGPTARFASQALTPAAIGNLKIVITHHDGEFGALSGVCNHAGGPLANGRMDGDYVTCPWHNWKYHRCTGLGEPGFELDAVPSYLVRVEDGELFVSKEAVTKRTRGGHEPHPLTRKIVRGPGPVRVVGISTTNMDVANPRYSTSDDLLGTAMHYAASELGAEAQTDRKS